MLSQTYGKVTDERLVEILNEYYQKNKHFGTEFNLTIGTDSQNFSDTKVVVVVAMQCVGHGGIFFYEIKHVDRLQDVRMKLNFETNLSLLKADRILQLIEEKPEYSELYLNTSFAIHVDAGFNPNGKTKDLVPEIVGWIKACGYECVVKPDSYAASSIANKISK